MKHFLTRLSIFGLSSASLMLAALAGGSIEAELVGIPVDVVEELLTIERAIEIYVGSDVSWNGKHPLCQEGLLGAYIPSEDRLVNCVANHQEDYKELVMTARHEGWHAVQHKCNNFRAALKDEQIRAHLDVPVKTTLRHSYHPNQHRAEAEARVIEQIPTQNWIKGVKEYCR